MSTSQLDLTDAEKRFVRHLAWWLEHDRTADSIPANFIHRREVHETLTKLGLPRAATIARFVSLGLLEEDFQDVTTDAMGHRIPLSATVYKILGGVVDVARKILSENPNAKPEASYWPQTLATRLKTSPGTLNTWAKKADVHTPSQGEKDFKYSLSDVEAICRLVSSPSGCRVRKTREAARCLLEEITAAKP